ncbi:unnamed protein product [marine sediment metagenome]|uniref:Uncharacterized protein n=1 Tax=marine sediment metagenome TaxID=412755 RepID=X1GEW4_9ZZZZ
MSLPECPYQFLRATTADTVAHMCTACHGPLHCRTLLECELCPEGWR